MVGERHTVALNERLPSSRDRTVSVKWPIVLDERLDGLLGRATDAGERTSRRELLAALLFHANYTGDQLGELLRTYRRATVAHAILDPRSANNNVIEIETRKPGPRASGT